jgi:hypothetical protein
VVLLPEDPPAERGVFWTDEGGEDLHTHAVFYGGGVGRGLVQTEDAGWDAGVVIPENPPASAPHSHVVEVLA